MIDLQMTVLDIIDRYPPTEIVFRQYEDSTKSCLLCSHLFDSLSKLVQQYSIDPDELLHRLQFAADHYSDPACLMPKTK